MPVDLSTYVLEFGKKHRGERIQRVPVSYLRWMVNERVGPWAIAKLEMERRGTEMPKIELSGHSIDTASLRIRRQWQQDRNQAEGLYSWLQRVTMEAIEQGEHIDESTHLWKGVKFVVHPGAEYPTLKTVIPMKRAREEKK